jgi:hypothetical protein
MPKTEDKTPKVVEVSSKVSAFLAGEQPRIISSDGTSEQAVQPYFRASMHAELLQQNVGSKTIQLRLGENTDIETVSYGLDLTEGQKRAKDAIQKLLDKTNYQGDGQMELNSVEFKIYDSFLPYLYISWTDYYQAYGLTPAGDGRYRGAQVKQAREDLESLTEMRWMQYERSSKKRDKDGKKLSDFIRVKKPLIQLQYLDCYHDLTQEEIRLVAAGQELPEDKQAGRVSKILLLPSPILIDEIESFYVLKPAGLYDEIKSLYPGKKVSPSYRTLIDTLITMNIWPEVKYRKENLARKINLHKYIEQRKKSLIEKLLYESLDTALKLNYILSYREDDTGLFWIRLNPERCSRLRDKLEKMGIDWREEIKPYKLARQKRLEKEAEDEKDSYITQ